MNLGVALLVVSMVAAAALVTVPVARWFRARRIPVDAGRADQVAPSPSADRETAVGGFYAPAFIVDPGHWFRLCRDPATGAARPCGGRVEGRGQFVDHRGNRVEVEACGVHMIDLDHWRFDRVDG